jgi:asparagine synthase (glutamine-hydrolysing)
MCGIAGYWSLTQNGRGRPGRLERLLDAMVYRGPDDSGIASWKQGEIGMRRLAVVDLETGHQPIGNEDLTVWAILNGEIYNHRDLRRELEERGSHTFRTHSDTEVLVHLYEEFGVDMLHRLNGMFAFCIVDVRHGRLLIARDRFGEKPLFYCTVSGEFWFASEPGALVMVPGVSRRAHIPAIHGYLASGFVHGAHTAFDSLYELPPGSWLRLESGAIEIVNWVRDEAPPLTSSSIDESAEELQTRLISAVRRQLQADVPVGAFLSGGIDSSAVVAAIRRVTTGRLRTFTARFEYAPYDESAVAREVASKLGTEHHEIFVPNRGFEFDDLMRIVRHVAQPFADSSAIPTYFVCREIRRHVTACLSGDGGDEMFAGYELFNWIARCDAAARVVPPAILRTTTAALGFLAGTGLGTQLPGLRRLWRGAEVAARPGHERLGVASRLFRAEEIAALTKDEGRCLGTLPPVAIRPSRGSRLRAMMDERVQLNLPYDMLVKVDRMSMAASLEVRAPMLDREIASFAAGLPDRMLLQSGVGKQVLRRAVASWLPQCVFDHPKTGFSIPLHKFCNRKYEAACHDLLLSGAVDLIRHLFDRRALELLLRRGLSQTRDSGHHSVYRSSHQLWAMVVLAAWAQEFNVSA